MRRVSVPTQPRNHETTKKTLGLVFFVCACSELYHLFGSAIHLLPPAIAIERKNDMLKEQLESARLAIGMVTVTMRTRTCPSPSWKTAVRLTRGWALFSSGLATILKGFALAIERFVLAARAPECECP